MSSYSIFYNILFITVTFYTYGEIEILLKFLQDYEYRIHSVNHDSALLASEAAVFKTRIYYKSTAQTLKLTSFGSKQQHTVCCIPT